MKRPKAGWDQKKQKWGAKGVNPDTGARRSYWGESPKEAEDKALASFGIQNYDTETLYGYYASAYLPSIARRSENWKSQVGWAMDKYVIPAFGHMKLGDITRTDCQKHFNKLSRDMKASSLAKVKIVFSGVMNLAEDDDVIAKNPVRRVRLPSPVEPDKTALTFEQLGRLIAHSPASVRPLVALMGCCGLRIGEACGTRRNMVRGSVLYVRRQILQVSGGAADTETLKTPQSRREIPLPPGLLAEIVREGDSIWLCPGKDGKFRLPNNVWRDLEPVFAIAKVPRVTMHELRHTFISLLENELDCPPAIVAGLAGKAKKGATAGYSHAHETQRKKWMDTFWSRVAEHLSTQEGDTSLSPDPSKLRFA